MRLFVTLFTIVCLIALWGCKTKKTATKAPEIPYTDTLKILTAYQTDSLEVFVRKIIINDSLFGATDIMDYNIVDARQQDSTLLITISSFKNCEKAEFIPYQSSVVLKTYPPRIRFRVGKGEMKACQDKPAMYTVAIDLMPILREYPEAHLMFTGSQKIVTVYRRAMY